MLVLKKKKIKLKSQWNPQIREIVFGVSLPNLVPEDIWTNLTGVRKASCKVKQ